MASFSRMVQPATKQKMVQNPQISIQLSTQLGRCSYWYACVRPTTYLFRSCSSVSSSFFKNRNQYTSYPNTYRIIFMPQLPSCSSLYSSYFHNLLLLHYFGCFFTIMLFSLSPFHCSNVIPNTLLYCTVL